MKTACRICVVCLAATTTAFCGMFAPVVFGPGFRNANWEPVFGVGFLISGLVVHPYVGNPAVGLIGSVIWPLLLTVGIAFATWRITAAPGRGAVVAGGFCAASFFLWISSGTASWLSLHYVPFFTNYSAVWY
jgi:hypothetical protein